MILKFVVTVQDLWETIPHPVQDYGHKYPVTQAIQSELLQIILPILLICSRVLINLPGQLPMAHV